MTSRLLTIPQIEDKIRELLEDDEPDQDAINRLLDVYILQKKCEGSDLVAVGGGEGH